MSLDINAAALAAAKRADSPATALRSWLGTTEADEGYRQQWRELVRQALDDSGAIPLLREYGRHSEGCSAACGPQYRCRCGWSEVEASL